MKCVHDLNARINRDLWSLKPVVVGLEADPYQSIDDKHNVTNELIYVTYIGAIETKIITKGGLRAAKGFMTMAEAPKQYEYIVPLVFADDDDARKHEPGAADTTERILTLIAAHEVGIKTAVSLNPIWDLSNAFDIVVQTYKFVDRLIIPGTKVTPQFQGARLEAAKTAIRALCDKLNVKLEEEI